MAEQMDPTRRALFLSAPHHQGGKSEAGAAIAAALGIPFPIRMGRLVEALQREGGDPMEFYPWLQQLRPPLRGPLGASDG